MDTVREILDAPSGRHFWPLLYEPIPLDQLAVVKLLLAAGADMTSCGALHLAAANGHEELTRLMVEAGADVEAVYSGTDMGFGSGEQNRTPVDCLDIHSFGTMRRRLFGEEYTKLNERIRELLVPRRQR